MKKLILMLAAAMLTCTQGMAIHAEEVQSQNTENFTVVNNDTKFDLSAYVMVPGLKLAQSLGLKTEWNKETKELRIDNGKVYVTAKPNALTYFITTSNASLVGMSAPVKFDVEPVLINDELYVPLAFINSLLDKPLHVNEGIISDIKTELPNPITVHKTLEELNKALNFEVKLPRITGYKVDNYRDYSKTLAAVTFVNDEKKIEYRMSVGTENNSGVFTQFEEVKNVTLSGTPVVFSKTENKVQLITWTKDNFSYSVYAPSGLSESAARRLVRSLL